MKIFDNVKALLSLVPASRTADANGTGVDTKGFNNAMIVIEAGDIDLTTGDETYAFTVQESDDNSAWSANISGLTASVTADNQVKTIEVKNLNTERKRYLRVVLDVEGTTPIIPCSALVLLGEPFSAPVN